MKMTMKLLTLILALAMVFTLCACDSGSNHSDDEDDDDDRGSHLAPAPEMPEPNEETVPTEPAEPSVPTAKEQAVLDAYCENLYNFCFSNDPVEQNTYYQQLIALDLSVIDKWKNTEFEPVEYNYHKINWDYKRALNSIIVVEDVMLKQNTSYTDFIGNVKEDYYYPAWSYNADGSVSSVRNEMWAFELIPANPAGLPGTREYTKNDAGQVTEVRYGSYNGTSNFTVEYLVTLTYDASGNKVKETVTDTDGDSFDILYTYDEANRLIQIDCNAHYPSTYTYTYSADGKLVEAKYSIKQGILYVNTMTYQYDASGKLVSGVMTYDAWNSPFFTNEQYIERTRKNQYTFTCDEEGRIVQIDIVPGDEYYVAGQSAGEVSSKASYALETITITYGNFYILDGSQLFTIG